MKRKLESTSSFDLFLDAICNAFGGIVFLAILIAVMAQNRGVVKSLDPTDKEPPSPDEVRELITRLDELEAEHAALQATIAALPEEAQRPEDSEYIALANQTEAMEQALAEAVKLQTEASRAVAEQLEKNAQAARENANVTATLAKSQAEFNATGAAFKSLVKTKAEVLKIPRVQVSASSASILLLKDHRLYVFNDPSRVEDPMNKDHVTTELTGTSSLKIEPIKGAGWPLRPGGDRSVGVSEFRRIVAEVRSNRMVIKLAVWPESYAEFDELRQIMIDEKVFYQLWPMEAFESLILTSGSGGSAVQ